MMTRLIWTVILVIGITGRLQAQSNIETSLKADFVSNYIWRGQNLGHVSLQPELSVGWKGLSLAVWGNVALNGHKEDNNEINLTLSYLTGGLSFGIIDYWNDEYNEPFFYFKKDGKGHAFEGFACYDFGPLSVSWQTFFAGNDYQEADGKRTFSSYFEIVAPFQLVTCDWEAEAGLVPWASDYYATSGFSVTNLSIRATKGIKITNSFSLPLFVQIVANPASRDLHLVAGLTLEAF